MKSNRKRSICITLAIILIIILILSLFSCSSKETGKDNTNTFLYTNEQANGNKEINQESIGLDNHDEEEASKKDTQTSDDKDKKDNKKVYHTHSYTSNITKQATCISEGIKTFTCKCGDSYEETIPKTKHTYKKTIVPASKDEDGYTIYTCTLCGDNYKDDYIDRLENNTGEKHTHKYSRTCTKKANCNTEGEWTYICSCGDSYKETIPKTNAHNFKDKVISPTENAKGYTLHTCIVCGYEYMDSYTEKISHTHSFAPVYDTVHHKAEGHWEYNVCIKDSWDEGIYESKIVCNKCGAFFSSDDEIFDHILISHDNSGSWHTDDVMVNTIHHDAVYEDIYIEDIPAYDEQVLICYKCYCGEIKDAY